MSANRLVHLQRVSFWLIILKCWSLFAILCPKKLNEIGECFSKRVHFRLRWFHWKLKTNSIKDSRYLQLIFVRTMFYRGQDGVAMIFRFQCFRHSKHFQIFFPWSHVFSRSIYLRKSNCMLDWISARTCHEPPWIIAASFYRIIGNLFWLFHFQMSLHRLFQHSLDEHLKLFNRDN